MTKLEFIKAKLASLLLHFATVKTDKAVLEYDAEELVVGTDVFVTNENGERKPAEDGNYVTEDEKTIVVADGKVAEIIEKEEEVEPTEEPAEETPAEEPTEEVTAEEEVTEETPAEEPTEEEPTEEPKDELAEKVTALEAKVEELIAIVEKLVEKSEADNVAVEERLSKIEKMSAAKPVEEVVEITKGAKKTGDAKMDARLAKAAEMSKDWRY
jgi:hypothetical protein